MGRRVESITSLRAFALLGVILYHILPNTFKGGYLGVVIFFTIAGFFMAKETEELSKFNYPRYISKRYLRLIGPLSFMIVIIAVLTLIFKQHLFVTLKGNIISSILGFNNYYQIYNGLDYFNSHINYAPLTHIWALSVEFQFYLFMPILLMFLRRKNQYTILDILGYMFLGSSIYLFILRLTASADFAYYSSLGRLASFSIGMFMYILFSKQLKRDNFKFPAKPYLITAIYLIQFIAMLKLNAQGKSVYFIGFALISLVTAYQLVLLYHDDYDIFKSLSFIGKRSYSLYLFEFSIISFITATLGKGGKIGFFTLLFAIILFIVLAELSYRLFEVKRNKKLTIVFLLLAIGVCLIPTSILKQKDDIQGALEQKQTGILRTHSEIKKVVNKKYQEKLKNDLESLPQDLKDQINEIGTKYPELSLKLEDYIKVRDKKVVFVGDSIGVMISNSLEELMINTTTSAEKNRHLQEYPGVLSSLLKTVPDVDYIVIEGGANDYVVSKENLEEIKKVAGSHTVIFTNIFVDSETLAERNAVIDEFAKANSNVYVADWYKIASRDQSILYDDLAHPNPSGEPVMAQLITKTISEIENKKGN